MTCCATPDIDVSAEAVAEHVAWLRRTKGLWAKAADECADALEIVAAERDNLRQTIQYSSTTLNFERRHREAFNLLCRIAAHDWPDNPTELRRALYGFVEEARDLSIDPKRDVTRKP